MYVFDTFAILAYFLAESGGGKVKELLRRAEIGASLVTGDPEFKAIKAKLSLFWLDK